MSKTPLLILLLFSLSILLIESKPQSHRIEIKNHPKEYYDDLVEKGLRADNLTKGHPSYPFYQKMDYKADKKRRKEILKDFHKKENLRSLSNEQQTLENLGFIGLIQDESNKVMKFVTNNIKKVFIESTMKKNQILLENNTIDKYEENTSEQTFDYELNIFRDSDALRKSYISKLISKNILNPNMKPKQHNSLIIFDWDDTLIPTTFLTPDGVFPEKILLSQCEFDKLKEIEKNVYIILKESIEKGQAYIITNACINWVQFSASIFYPSIIDLLKKVKIISARGEYEQSFPDNLRQWKIQAFSNLIKDFDENLVTNIICIGDSLFEMEAGRILASKCKEAFIKTIKFREAPKLDELLKQLKLVAKQFDTIYSSIKNMTIRIEKKKKEEQYY